jgi:CHASE2 domain-containing sensor protein
MQIGSILMGTFAAGVTAHANAVRHGYHDSRTDALAAHGLWLLLVPIGWTILYVACARTERDAEARWLLGLGVCFALLYGVACLATTYRAYIGDLHG